MMRISVSRWTGTAALLMITTSSLSGCPGPRPVTERPSSRVNPVEGLEAQLKDNDWQKRADAARRLGATGHADAVAPLAGAVGDSDQRVRLAVVQACGAHRSPKLIPALKKGLVDKERAVRRGAVQALARVGTPEAAEAMIDALDGASMWLRPAVADGLAALPAKVLEGLTVAIQILVAELDSAKTGRFRRLAKGLAAIGEPALRILVLAVYKPAGLLAKKHLPADLKCRRGPCRALVAMGPKVLATLLIMGKDGIRDINSWNLYHRILPAVARHIGKAAIPYVIKSLGEPGSRGAMAENTLPDMGVAAVQPLLTQLRKPGQPARVRAAAVRVLGKIRDKRATAVLIQALKDPNRAVNEPAAEGLAKRPTAETFTALAKRLKSGPKVQRLAIVRGARHAKGELATRLLLLALNQSELTVALSAAQALGKRKAKSAVPTLLAALNKPPGTMQLAAVEALGRIGDQRATEPLVRVSKGRGTIVLRLAAVSALGVLKDPRAYKTLARHARRGDKKLRLMAIGALGNLGTKRAKKLLGRLKKSRDKAIARAAAIALNPVSAAFHGPGQIGIPACDRYLKVFACYVSKMPASTQAATMAVFQKTIQAWKKMAAGPARAAIGKACQMALGAWRKAVSTTPRYRSCFGP